MSIGSQISQARSQKGWTQQQLAEATGISLRTVQRIENDQVNAQFHTIHKLEEILQVSILSADESLEEAGKVVRMMSACILLVFLPILGNVIIPFIIVKLRAKDKRSKKLGGSILMFQVLWTITFFVSEMIIFNLAEMIWGESNPGNFSPIMVVFAIFWLVNSLFALTITFQSAKGHFSLLEKIPSIY